MQKGFNKSDSVVSIFSGWSLNDIAWYSPLPIHEVIRGWLEHFFSFGTSQATLILDPIVADDVTANGYRSKEDFAKYLADNTGTPGWLYWSNNQDALKQAEAGVEPYAGWLKKGTGFVVPVSRYKGGFGSRNTAFIASKDTNEPTTSIEIVVTGGGTNTFWSGGDFGYIGSASVDYWR